MGGTGRDEAVLDLSAWPQQGPPPATPPRAGLPPRPVRRRRLPAVGLGRLAAGLGAVAGVLLAVPLPGTGCPSAVSVWAADPRPAPSSTPPALDDATAARDRAAVAGATDALAVQDARVAAARKVLATRTPTRTAGGSVVASADVAGLESAVRTDTAARDQAKAALDRVVEQQQAADDPSAYDADVAAAQEDLDVAEARLADDQRALAAARRSGAAATAAPAPTAEPGRAAAQSVVAAAAGVRAGLVQQLTAAKHAQADHLAQRGATLSSWATRHAHDVAVVTAANARLAGCGGTANAAGGSGVLLGLTSGGLLLLRRRRP